MPVPVVAATVFVEFFPGISVRVGYGETGNNCWIGNPTGTFVAFGVPVLCALLASAALTTLTLLSIRKSFQIANAALSRSGSSKAWVYMRISFMMGFTWIFGFIYPYVDSRVPEYIFIVLNASYGLLLTLLLTMTSKVVGKLKSGFMARFHLGKQENRGTAATNQQTRTVATAGGTGATAGGTGAMAGGTGKMAGGTWEKASGTGEIAGGTGDIAGGTGEMAGGTGAVANGTGEMTGGTWEMAGGTGAATGGTKETAGGTGEMAGGNGETAGGNGAATGGTEEMAGGTGEMAGGTGEMAGGTGEMAGGTGEMAGGTVEMAGGTGAATGGTGKMVGGTGEMAGGTGEMAGGTDNVGTQQAPIGGTKEMARGAGCWIPLQTFVRLEEHKADGRIETSSPDKDETNF
ncbi:ADGRE5 [Branchiostoma lanceolatum]|uniref:ADGRE5 protein n=1 Tax=Branchiostoma lanceolatum TaxID=7740 RepID=A0A8J9ZNU8_BRALA|nr:ADGRE5 [Branchiostoma lanceolatum]